MLLQTRTDLGAPATAIRRRAAGKTAAAGGWYFVFQVDTLAQNAESPCSTVNAMTM